MFPQRLGVVDQQAADPTWHSDGVQFIEATASGGMPWLTSRAEAADRGEPTRWFDFKDVLRLNRVDVLGLGPVGWYLDPGPEQDLCAAFWCDVWLQSDVRANHVAVAERITSAIGPGTDTSVSNTVETTWAVGFVTVRALSFPLELQTDMGSNPLHQAHPELWLRTQVDISTSMANPSPLPELTERRVAATWRRPVEVSQLPVCDAQIVRPHGLDIVGTPISGCEIWADEHWVCTAATRLSAAVRRASIVALDHEVATPARGAGSTTLVARLADGRSHVLLHGPRYDDFDRLAPELADFLGVDVRRDEYEDF